MLQITTYQYTLHFKQPAGTSRGVYTTRNLWFVVATDGEKIGIGECAPLPNLSCDHKNDADYYHTLQQLCKQTEQKGYIDYEMLRHYPSVLFGLETAMQQLSTNSFTLWPSDFTKGERGIQINGLIWMGNYDEMLSRIDEKRKAGFKCIKLKIGAINFEQELSLIKHIRNTFSSKEIELRVDANGAFQPSEAMQKLEQLAKFDLHSIEQPIKARQWDKMAELCKQTPLPIALDEELIGANDIEEKKEMLDTICPQYIILKPSLHGGLYGSNEWITLAQQRNIGWWITSALESNIGLNAIAQWCATKNTTMPQGLGTGALFTDNFPLPLNIIGDKLFFNQQQTPTIESIIRKLK